MMDHHHRLIVRLFGFMRIPPPHNATIRVPLIRFVRPEGNCHAAVTSTVQERGPSAMVQPGWSSRHRMDLIVEWSRLACNPSNLLGRDHTKPIFPCCPPASRVGFLFLVQIALRPHKKIPSARWGLKRKKKQGGRQTIVNIV